MNENLTTPPPDNPNTPAVSLADNKISSGIIALRALLGLLVYVGVGWLSLAFGRGNFTLLVLLVIIAIVMAITRTGRGFPLGVLIGVGLTLLGVGACFLLFANFKMG